MPLEQNEINAQNNYIEQLTGQKGHLSEEHINNGTPGDCQKCPFALLIGDMAENTGIDYDNFEIEVDGNTANIAIYNYKLSKTIGITIPLPPSVERWIVNYDRKKPVEQGTLRFEAGQDRIDWENHKHKTIQATFVIS